MPEFVKLIVKRLPVAGRPAFLPAGPTAVFYSRGVMRVHKRARTPLHSHTVVLTSAGTSTGKDTQEKNRLCGMRPCRTLTTVTAAAAADQGPDGCLGDLGGRSIRLPMRECRSTAARIGKGTRKPPHGRTCKQSSTKAPTRCGGGLRTCVGNTCQCATGRFH